MRGYRQSIFSKLRAAFSGRRASYSEASRIAAAALDSTATSPRTADYYRDAINEPAALTFDRFTREVAQARGQHEFLNDPLFYGACNKIAALVVGTGPALKITGPEQGYYTTPLEDVAKKSQYLENCWKRFADAVDVVGDMRLIETELLFHGEAFCRKVRSASTVDGFDYVFIRPERIADPPGVVVDPTINDGIQYDRADDAAAPVGYYVQRENVNPMMELVEFDFVPAGEIIHIFNRILPQQRRGVPEVQSALGLIRELKLLRGLEIQAVKNAAKTSVILHTDAPIIMDSAYRGEEIEAPRPGTRAELPDGVFIARPGYTPTFGESKHPASGFDVFKRLLTADVGAALGIGSGAANNDHSPYNFSSAKMDEQIDGVNVEIRQKKLATAFLDVLFNDWILEFSTRDQIAGEFLDAAGAPENIGRRWLFPAPRSIDRQKDAAADEIELRNNTITLEQIAARRGLDYEELIETRARELKTVARMMQESGLGLSTTGAISTAAPPETPAETEEMGNVGGSGNYGS